MVRKINNNNNQRIKTEWDRESYYTIKNEKVNNLENKEDV
jgi:hypothetical protein